ncbi:MAG: hypothetical protein CL752_07145 [Chloroflexi bacterium]|nr:hypothetical protein [Chloroflexota bacterium]
MSLLDKPFSEDLPLSGVKVLDISQGVAGPYAAKLLGGMGADVISVEPPIHGDYARLTPPFFEDDPHLEKSGLFLYLNTDKRSITLDLSSAQAQSVMKPLIEWADIIIENYAPDTLENLGLSYKDIEKISRKTTLVSITEFGQSGPYKDYQGTNLISLALGGLLQITGDVDKEPLKVGGRPAEYIAGLSAFSGAMIALYAQRASGEGQHVDVSMVEAIATAQMYSGLNYAYLGENRVRANDIAPMYQVSNGHVGVMYRQGNWDDFCDMIGRPEMKDDERFIDNVARRENIIELNQIVSEWMIKQDKTELYHLAQGQRMPFGYICDAEDLISSEQYIHRGYFVEIDHPVCGKLLYPGHSFFWDGEKLPMERAPLLGEHNESIYEALGFSKEELSALTEKGVI